MPCFCGNESPYEACCGRFHSGHEVAGSAELLMRSRYSAYVMALEDYLLTTWHASTRPSTLDFSGADNTQWLGLDLKRHVVIDAERAQVEFIARYKSAGQSAVRLHEISDFVFEDGHWFYLSGSFPT